MQRPFMKFLFAERNKIKMAQLCLHKMLAAGINSVQLSQTAGGGQPALKTSPDYGWLVA